MIPPSLTAAWALGLLALIGALLVAVIARKAQRDLVELTSGRRRAGLREAAPDAKILRYLGEGRIPQEDVIAALFTSPRVVPGAVDRLVPQVTDRRAHTRGRTAVLLAILGGDHAVMPLSILLADRDPDVRLAAANGLETLGGPRAARALLAAASEGRLQRARAVERLGHPWAVPALLAAGASATPGTRIVIAQALGLAGDQAATPALRMALRSRDVEERIQAARALGQLRSPAALPDLTAALRDERWEVRAQAATALGRLADDDAVPALTAAATDAAWWVRANATSALAALGGRGLAALEELAGGDDRYAAERAAEALDALAHRHATAAA